ncbi:MAG: dTMP kinase [Bacteroidales bacterium]
MPQHPTPHNRHPAGRQLLDRIKAREQTRGLLIAFEGPDGAGKTTQRRLFKAWLESEGCRVITSKRTSSSVFKPVVKARKRARSLSASELALLQAAEFRLRLETEILPALWQGTTVLADRYLFTGLARAAARDLELDWLLHLYSPLFWPDIVFNFAVSPETATTRVAADGAPEYYQAGQDVTGIADAVGSYEKFVGRVIREYEAFALIFQFVTIDGEQPIYEQHRRIRALFEEGRRRPWGQWNMEAVVEWLQNGGTAKEMRGGG